jgi:hypothetical protein
MQVDAFRRDRTGSRANPPASPAGGYESALPWLADDKVTIVPSLLDVIISR